MEDITDQITHQTRTNPKFKDRIRILFGATIVIDSIIKLDRVAEVEWSTAKDTYKFRKS